MPLLAPLDPAAIQIPYHFRCPISLELMRDPVTVSTGITYDRSSIDHWLSTGNVTCPVTRAPLPDFNLIPNHTLRRLIQDWCVAHRAHGVERIPTPKQPADADQVRALLAKAAAGTGADRVAALRKIRALARESDKNRAVISTSDTRASIIAIAFDDGVDEDVEAEAMAVLSIVGVAEAAAADAIASDETKLKRLANAVRCAPTVDARVNAAAVIESAAAAADSNGRAALGAAEGLIDGLVALLQESYPARAPRVATRALFALCLAKENRPRAIDAGAAEALGRRIGETLESVATAELLCRTESGRDGIVAGAGGGAAAVGALVRAMSGKAAEHAAGALAAVVGGNDALQREAVKSGAMGQLLLMVQGGCSERAKRKAQLLLKMLRSAWPAADHIANSDDFLQPY